MSKLTDSPNYSAKTKKRVKKGILASAFIVIVVMSILLTRPPMIKTIPGKISVSLNAQVFRDGILVNEVTKDDDLLLENFVNLIEGVLDWPNGATSSYELTETGGNAYNYVMWKSTSQAAFIDTNSVNSEAEATYGEGTTAPARDDIDCETQKEQEAITSYSEDADSFTLTFIHVNTEAVGWDWSETTYQINWFCASEGNDYDICLVRDTFTPMGVILNDVMVINYKFNFATGYTENMITFLYTLLKGTEGATTVTCSLTDTSGTSRTVTIYSDANDADWFGSCSTSLYGGYILVSDSTYGIPSRTAYLIYGSSLQTTVTTDIDYVNYDVTLSSVFIPTAEISIVASAYYRSTAHSGGSAYFMMFALTHGSVYVAAGTPVKATFTVGL